MSQVEIPQLQTYTHSLKLEETAKGIRLSVHCYATDRQTAINEAITTYLETKEKCEKEKILVAPMELK